MERDSKDIEEVPIRFCAGKSSVRECVLWDAVTSLRDAANPNEGADATDRI